MYIFSEDSFESVSTVLKSGGRGAVDRGQNFKNTGPKWYRGDQNEKTPKEERCPILLA